MPKRKIVKRGRPVKRKKKLPQTNTPNRISRQSNVSESIFKHRGRSNFAQALQLKYCSKPLYLMISELSDITKKEFLDFYLFLEQHNIRVSDFFKIFVKNWTKGDEKVREFVAESVSDIILQNRKSRQNKKNMQRKKFVKLEKQRQLIQSQFDFVFSSQEIDNILQEINEGLDKISN